MQFQENLMIKTVLYVSYHSLRKGRGINHRIYGFNSSIKHFFNLVAFEISIHLNLEI